mmetsp:Transcript_10974/g.24169  ORF Transcript_10974/g.24169 Transcript_10974/m.24169 type:complete len:112 (+) Transcript_10974:408-743(+)
MGGDLYGAQGARLQVESVSGIKPRSLIIPGQRQQGSVSHVADIPRIGWFQEARERGGGSNGRDRASAAAASVTSNPWPYSSSRACTRIIIDALPSPSSLVTHLTLLSHKQP